MGLIVQKYGGSSLADNESILSVVKRIQRTRYAGHDVVVVVSAQKGVTNQLIQKARSLNLSLSSKEMDVLLSAGEQESMGLMAMALESLGVPVVARTGAQAGIFTDDFHTKAQILNVSGGDIGEQLNKGCVVVVAGFQGVSLQGDITTLGRGGSDLTAIALADCLKADRCEILTDVQGVFTADPRRISTAQLISTLSHDEMVELSGLGYRVMQTKAAQYAHAKGVDYEIGCSRLNSLGTRIVSAQQGGIRIKGIALDDQQVKVSLRSKEINPGKIEILFDHLKRERIPVDMLTHRQGEQGDILTFTVAQVDFQATKAVVDNVVYEWHEDVGMGYWENIVKLSAVGKGLMLDADAAAQFFKGLAQAEVTPEMSLATESRISCLVSKEHAMRALACIHNTFFEEACAL